jgi:hypothetical protein
LLFCEFCANISCYVLHILRTHVGNIWSRRSPGFPVFPRAVFADPIMSNVEKEDTPQQRGSPWQLVSALSFIAMTALAMAAIMLAALEYQENLFLEGELAYELSHREGACASAREELRDSRRNLEACRADLSERTVAFQECDSERFRMRTDVYAAK